MTGSFDRIELGELRSAVLHVAIRDGRVAGRVADQGRHRGGDSRSRAAPAPDDGVPLDTVTNDAITFVVVEEEEGPHRASARSAPVPKSLVRALGSVVATVGLLLPFIPVAVVITALYWWIRRWLRGRRSGRSIPPDSSPNRPQHPPDNPND